MADDFLVQLQPRVLAGQEFFRSTMNRLVQLSRPDLIEVLSGNDDAFLEPLAFLSFSLNQPASNLDQIFAGYAVSNNVQARLTVTTESDGSFYVPELGYFSTGQKNSTLQLVLPADKSAMYLEYHGSSLPYRLEPVVRLSDTSIELVQRPIELMANCFVDLDGSLMPVSITKAVEVHAANLARAVILVSQLWPTLYQMMVQTVRRLVLFRAEGMNSFATTAAHGTAFINVALGDNELFFVEDLAHQCGHVIFSAASAEAGEDFVVPPSTPISVFNQQPDDLRSVYVVLHGVFTEALMAKCLDTCLSEQIFEAHHEHELRGRLAFILRRFGADLRNISKPGILSLQGEALVHALWMIWTEITRRRKEMTDSCDFSGQGYNFCYRTFAEQNSENLHAYVS